MLKSALLITSVYRHSPLLAFQILTVLSPDADASRAESWEKATELILSLWPLIVCRHLPLLATLVHEQLYHLQVASGGRCLQCIAVFSTLRTRSWNLKSLGSPPLSRKTLRNDFRLNPDHALPLFWIW